MDYETKPTSRKDLRRYATYFRKLFDVPQDGAFPVLEVLDKLSDVFEGSNYVIVDDKALPPQTMAQCTPNDRGGFTPIYTRSFANNEIPAYRSVEWQAKALCAEVMIPYEESIGMKPKQIVDRYHVSKAFAKDSFQLRIEGLSQVFEIKEVA